MSEQLFLNTNCMDFMSMLPDGYFDLALIDPPYFAGPNKRRYYGRKVSPIGVQRVYDECPYWEVPGKEFFDELLRVAKHYIVWGCNYFDYHFAPGRIVWDKVNGTNSFSDAEIAATDLMQSVRLFPYMWNGMFQGKSITEGRVQQGNKKLNESRIHPTQKPVKLYEWQLSRFAQPGWKIFDSHVGSASSLIACENLGFDYVGCEIDPEVYRKAELRLQEERLIRARMLAGVEAAGEAPVTFD